MTEREIIQYIETLPNEDWNVLITSRWNLRDVVAHMVGWTELDVASLERIWETGTLPWREKGFDVDKYNAQSVTKYLKTTPEKLIKTWNKLLDKRDEQIKSVGKENIKRDKELFYYLFEEGNAKHTLHHYQQIREALGK